MSQVSKLVLEKFLQEEKEKQIRRKLIFVLIFYTLLKLQQKNRKNK